MRGAVAEIADDLLEIHAARETEPGIAIDPDTPWQIELEASFPYVETPDQHRAIEEVRSDQEAAKPMDRLIVGDVGYGKTEVAIRAAFKAVMSGYQVAVLVPTTVLAQQHYETFPSATGGDAGAGSASCHGCARDPSNRSPWQSSRPARPTS